MIYIDDHIDEFDLQQALTQVSPSRREYALRYRHERDQRCCVAAYRLLQRALLQQYGLGGTLELIHDRGGRPALAGYPDIHISLSHCREAVAVAVDDQPIGIDIETLDHYSEDVAHHVMSEAEMQQILSAVEPATTFTRLWTMKESLFKLTGSDNGGDIAHVLDEAWRYHFTTIVHPSYLCTTVKKH